MLIGWRAPLIAIVAALILAAPANAIGGDWTQDLGNGWWVDHVSGETTLRWPDGKDAIGSSQIGINELTRYAWAGQVLLVEAESRFFVLREADTGTAHSMDEIEFGQALKSLGIAGSPEWKPVRADRFLLVPAPIRWTLGLAAVVGIAYVLIARWRNSRSSHTIGATHSA